MYVEPNRADSLEERIERDDRLRISSRRLERLGASSRESASEQEARWRKSAWTGAENSLAYYMKVCQPNLLFLIVNYCQYNLKQKCKTYKRSCLSTRKHIKILVRVYTRTSTLIFPILI